MPGDQLRFEPTRIVRVAPAIEPATGFHVQTIGTLFAEILPGKKSGAHRHSYEETENVIAGNGYSIVEDQRIEWKKATRFVYRYFPGTSTSTLENKRLAFSSIITDPIQFPESSGHLPRECYKLTIGRSEF